MYTGGQWKDIAYAGSGGSLTTDQTIIIANQLKGPVTEVILSDGAFTTSSIRRISGVDISRPVNNVVNSGDITTTLGDLGETSGSLNGEILYAKVEGSAATWTIEPDSFYVDGSLQKNKKVFLDTGDNVVFENNTLGGWDLYGSYELINGYTNFPYSTNTNPNLVTGALAFGNSSQLEQLANDYSSSTVTVVPVTEHPYDNSHAIRITAEGTGTLKRATFSFGTPFSSGDVFQVAIAHRVVIGGDGRYRFSGGTSSGDHNTIFSNTGDFVVDEFEATSDGTELRLDLFASYGTSDDNDYSEFFAIFKLKQP